MIKPNINHAECSFSIFWLISWDLKSLMIPNLDLTFLSVFFGVSLTISHKLAVMFHVAMEAFHDRVSNFELLCGRVLMRGVPLTVDG